MGNCESDHYYITYQYIYLGLNWITVLSRFKDHMILLNMLIM
jgi:hypothetical protein